MADRVCEGLTQSNFANRLNPGAEIRGTFPEDVVLDGRTLRQRTAELGDRLLLSHQVDFRLAEFLPAGQVPRLPSTSRSHVPPSRFDTYCEDKY